MCWYISRSNTRGTAHHRKQLFTNLSIYLWSANPLSNSISPYFRIALSAFDCDSRLCRSCEYRFCWWGFLSLNNEIFYTEREGFLPVKTDTKPLTITTSPKQQISHCQMADSQGYSWESYTARAHPPVIPSSFRTIWYLRGTAPRGSTSLTGH